MAYRDRSTKGKLDSFDYCVVQVLLTKDKDRYGGKSETHLMTIDNHLETIRFVKKNMDECIHNIVRIQRTADGSQETN